MNKTLRFVLMLALAAGFALPLAAQNLKLESFQGKNVVSGEILVRFRGASAVQSQALVAQDLDIESAEPAGLSGAVLLRSRGRDVTTLLQAYGSRLDVVYAEPNYIWTADDLPNDAYLSWQWGLRNTAQPIFGVSGTINADIKAGQAWDISEGSRRIVVGVVDSGVDYTHPDLRDNIWSAPTAFTVRINGKTISCPAGTHGFNAITRSCDPMDDNLHGTFVSGIIGASGNNGTGVSGVSRVANIMAMKFLGPTGSGSTIDAVAAMDFVLQVKAIFPLEANIRALNNSWGGGGFSQALLDEIRLLNDADVLFVASAGNSATNNDLTAAYPANFEAPNVVSVAATDNKDALASFSNWGPTAVDLGAPGVAVLSTIPGGLYGFGDGTSFAAPMVTGAAALVLSACPLATAALKADLMGSVDEVPSLAEHVVTSGRLNVYRALSACLPSPQPAFSLTVSPGVQALNLGGSANLKVTATSLSGFYGPIALSTVLPSGVTATFNPQFIEGGSGTSTLTLAANSTLRSGTYSIPVIGNSGSLERRSNVSLEVALPTTPIGLNQTRSGTLTETDRLSKNQDSETYADFYTLTLDAATPVTIDLKSGIFDAVLYVMSPTGDLLFSNDNSGGNGNARISATLAAGVYTIEATSGFIGEVGNYTLSINTPTLTAISPRTLTPNSTATVTFTGTRFTSPMTITVGPDITVSNIVVTSATQARATLTVAANAAPGPREVTVTTADGVSNPMAFPVPTRIDPGQSIAGSVSTTDLVWPNTLFKYTDLYQLSLNATTAVQIDVRSTGFDSVVGLFSPTGALIAADSNTGGPDYDRIITTLPAGTYFMEVTAVAGPATGNYVLSVNMPGLNGLSPRFIEAGATANMTLSGSRFAAPLTIDAGSDVTISNVSVTGTTIALATATVSANAEPGNRVVTATTPVGTTNPLSLRVVPPIPAISLGQTITGSLSSSDPIALDVPGAYMNLYRMTVSTTTRVRIDLTSDAFDVSLWGLSSSGSPIFLNNDSNGTRNARLTGIFAPGTYFIEVTSSLDNQGGLYTLSLTPEFLGVTTISPRYTTTGSEMTVNLTGNGFAAPLMIDAGPGITVSNVVVNNSSSATATFTTDSDAPLGTRDLNFTTSDGANGLAPLTFTVYPITPIALGETKTGALSLADRASPNRAGVYGDLYRLTLTSPASVEIGLNSTAFDSFVYLMNSSGTIMNSDDSNGGRGNARIALVLAAGTYMIEATSSTPDVGDYTLSVAVNPTTLNFPRSFSPAELALTNFAIVNPTGNDATVKFTMYGDLGVQVSSATETVPARGQLSKLGSEILKDVTRNGWVQVTSDTIGLKAFWMGGDFVNTMDGAEAAPEASELLFPLIAPLTELNVANVGTGVNTITIGGYNAAGTLVALATRILPENGVFRTTIATLFPGLTTATSIRLTGTNRMAATSVLSDFPVGPSMTVLNGVTAQGAATSVFFPHVASGGGWTSLLGVANTSTTVPELVTLTFTPTTGSPVSVIRTLGPRGSLRESVQTMFGLSGAQEGWVRVSGPTITAYVAYGYSSTGGATVVPGQGTARTAMLFDRVATGPNWATGLALLNPSTTTDANVQVFVLRKTGALVGSYSVTLPRGTKLAKLLTEMVPASSDDDGFVYVQSSVPIYGTQSVFSRDQRTISNIPPSALEPGVGYVPPSP